MRKQKIVYVFLALSFVMCIYACRKALPFDNRELDERFTADVHTTFDDGNGAYGHVINGLTDRETEFHDLGDEFFGKNFVPYQQNYHANGLGPLYNNVSCGGCHLSDGRGRPPLPGEKLTSMFFKLALPGADAQGFPNKVPGFGIQLQDKSLFGTAQEGEVALSYQENAYTFPDGEVVYLRAPTYSFINLYQPLPAQVLFSPRIARPNYGIGFLEAISEESILRNSDPNDADQDGISGKPNYVYDFVHQKANVLGRIGWKASVANIKSQVSKALNEDIGVTNYIVKSDNAKGQIQEGTNLGLELPDSIVDAITFYIRTLSVPARRNVDNEDVKLGKKLFVSVGCYKCHTPEHQTKVDPSFKQLSGLNITPYTDMLLHDMGSNLADGFSEFEANGNEWRTPPLWGIGLTKKINGNTFFMHDGRARSYLEAILWHGGEANTAKSRFTQLEKNERAALIKFLESL
ncbi:MAG: c-type cytochrome [Bacteroidetes bacterium]|nr:c-type cytochrome [Bacteroidota bacterium]